MCLDLLLCPTFFWDLSFLRLNHCVSFHSKELLMSVGFRDCSDSTLLGMPNHASEQASTDFTVSDGDDRVSLQTALQCLLSSVQSCSWDLSFLRLHNNPPHASTMKVIQATLVGHAAMPPKRPWWILQESQVGTMCEGPSLFQPPCCAFSPGTSHLGCTAASCLSQKSC